MWMNPDLKMASSHHCREYTTCDVKIGHYLNVDVAKKHQIKYGTIFAICFNSLIFFDNIVIFKGLSDITLIRGEENV